MTIQEKILESFYDALGQTDAIDDATIESLRQLFQSEKKIKADDLITILTREGAQA